MSFMFNRRAQEAHRYPKPALPLGARRAIVAAIVEAWAELVRDAGWVQDEDTATAVLALLLNAIRGDATRVPTFNAAVFSMLVRDGRYVNYNGAQLHKRPDLLVRLADEVDENVGWFVECKIVDASPSHRLSYYQTRGIVRFEEGEYAWAMPTAMMIAYAGAGYVLPERLTEILGTAPTACLDYPDIEVWQTDHQRIWHYPGTLRTAGPIALHHLWLTGAQFGEPPDPPADPPEPAP